MASVFDVSEYILQKLGSTTHMKLQKLAYYSQAWSLVWDDAPLYPEPIQAWANGPVVPALYRELRGKFGVSSSDLPGGNPDCLTESQKATVDAVLDHYGDKGSQWLSDLTHMEDPWRDARAGLPPGAASSKEITPAAMAEYYGGL